MLSHSLLFHSVATTGSVDATVAIVVVVIIPTFWFSLNLLRFSLFNSFWGFFFRPTDAAVVVVFEFVGSISLKWNHTHVVVRRVVRVNSMLPKRLLKNNDLNVVRNCFDIRPYRTKSMAAFIRAKRSINSPKGG